jgi:hypothetical protein
MVTTLLAISTSTRTAWDWILAVCIDLTTLAWVGLLLAWVL